MFAFLTLLVALLFSPPPSPDVILITIDGVRWQEVYGGTDHWRWHGRQMTSRQLLPNLYDYFVDDGVAVGLLTPIVASGPNHISLPGYLEITRGHPSFDCQLNSCRPYIDQSVFWFFQHPAVFSSWTEIKETIPSNSNVYRDVGTDWYRWDNATELAAISYLDQQTPDFLWVSLGDTDEMGHLNDYPRYIESLQMADIFIGYLVERYPNATFIVTADHGRNTDFKDHGIDKSSERVWLMMRGPNVPHRGLVAADSLSLSNVMPTITDIEFDSQSKDSILSRLK
jgi:hypothetical protein